MSYEGKYFKIVKLEDKPRTKVYGIYSKHYGDLLGTIKWYAPWRQYCFFPEHDTIWSNSCLREVIDFVGELIENWILSRKKERDEA